MILPSAKRHLKRACATNISHDFFPGLPGFKTANAGHRFTTRGGSGHLSDPALDPGGWVAYGRGPGRPHPRQGLYYHPPPWEASVCGQEGCWLDKLSRQPTPPPKKSQGLCWRMGIDVEGFWGWETKRAAVEIRHSGAVWWLWPKSPSWF